MAGKSKRGKLRAGVVGHSGYSGAELVKILARHPRVEPVLVDHRADAGEPLMGRPIERTPWSPEALVEKNLAVLFLATPPEVSIEDRKSVV